VGSAGAGGEPYYPKAKTGRPPFSVETILRIHYMQQWFALSDPPMEEALHDLPAFREFALLSEDSARLPDETTIPRFHHLLEKQDLAADMLGVVNDIQQARKGNQWYFGMKAHIGVHADSGLVHSVVGTAASVNDVTQDGALLHDEEETAFGDADYLGVHKRSEAHGSIWHVAMRPGLHRELNPFIETEFLAV
jgi:transposase, IS5 family